MEPKDRGRESARQKLTELEREVVEALEAGGYEPYVKGVADGQTYEGGRYFPQVRWSNINDPENWGNGRICSANTAWCEGCVEFTSRLPNCRFGNLTKWQIEHFNLIQKLTTGIFAMNNFNRRGWIPVQEPMSVDDWMDLEGHPTVKVYRIDVEFFCGKSRVINHDLPEEHSENISSQ